MRSTISSQGHPGLYIYWYCIYWYRYISLRRPSDVMILVANLCSEAMVKRLRKLKPEKADVLDGLDPLLSDAVQLAFADSLGVLMGPALLQENLLSAASGSPSPSFLNLRLSGHTFVTSLLDYCNMLYSGLPLKTTLKLQLVQHVAVSVACLKSTRAWTFSIAVPAFWNGHPKGVRRNPSLEIFRKHDKPCMFARAFDALWTAGIFGSGIVGFV